MTPPVPPAPAAPTRPMDVDTGFWLWLVAVPLMVIGQVADAYAAAKGSTYVFATTCFVVTIIAGVVVGFLMLVRSGYRWARTLLTGGGLATIFFTAASLFATGRPPLPAVIYAFTGIFGVVFIAGGIYLLHRPDSHRFFTR